jgi:hypothetical protein
MSARHGVGRANGRRSGGEAQTRREITAEAARIMAEEGVQDFFSAKRKAAGRLNLPEDKNLPSNQEVEEALRAHLTLFHADLPATLRHLREVAAEAMTFLAPFEPRLTGTVLSGSVTKYSDVQLHVAADSPEDLGLFLHEHAIPYDELDKRLRFGDRFDALPAFRFIAGDTPVEVCVFSREGIREAPLSPVDGKPMKRANLKEVQRLIEEAPGRARD